MMSGSVAEASSSCGTERAMNVNDDADNVDNDTTVLYNPPKS